MKINGWERPAKGEVASAYGCFSWRARPAPATGRRLQSRAQNDIVPGPAATAQGRHVCYAHGRSYVPQGLPMPQANGRTWRAFASARNDFSRPG